MKIKIIVFLSFLSISSYAKIEDSLKINYPKYFKEHRTFLEEDFCDACGCSASGGSMGFASMLNANFIGIRYFNQQYATSDGLYSNSVWYAEKFNTMQLWTRIPVVKNVQVSAVVPFHFHERNTKDGKEAIQGLGDITVLAMYRLYQTHKDSTVLVHTLQVGGGLKFPTGKYNQSTAGSVNPSFQVGTGSWDYLVSSEYTIRRKKIGFNTMLNYIWKSYNNKSYKFGNQFNYAGTLFYLYERDNGFSIAPQLGFAGEVYASNAQYLQNIRNTSGDIFFSKIGVEMGKNRLSIGANWMLPLVQNLSNGNVEAKSRWTINCNFSL